MSSNPVISKDDDESVFEIIKTTNSGIGLRSRVQPITVKVERRLEGMIKCPHEDCLKKKIGLAVSQKGCNIVTCTNHDGEYFYFCCHCKKPAPGGETSDCSCPQRNNLDARKLAQQLRNEESRKKPICIADSSPLQTHERDNLAAESAASTSSSRSAPIVSKSSFRSGKSGTKRRSHKARPISAIESDGYGKENNGIPVPARRSKRFKKSADSIPEQGMDELDDQAKEALANELWLYLRKAGWEHDKGSPLETFMFIPAALGRYSKTFVRKHGKKGIHYAYGNVQLYDLVQKYGKWDPDGILTDFECQNLNYQGQPAMEKFYSVVTQLQEKIEYKDGQYVWNERAFTEQQLLDQFVNHGIPAKKEELPTEEYRRLEERVRFAHVDLTMLTSARQGINGYSTCILHDYQVKPILEQFDFEKDDCGKNYFQPGGRTAGKSSMSLDEVRYFVRRNKEWHVDSRRRTQKRTNSEDSNNLFALRLWAATSPNPLPKRKSTVSTGSTDNKNCDQESAVSHCDAVVAAPESTGPQGPMETTADKHSDSVAESGAHQGVFDTEEGVGDFDGDEDRIGLVDEVDSFMFSWVDSPYVGPNSESINHDNGMETEVEVLRTENSSTETPETSLTQSTEILSLLDEIHKRYQRLNSQEGKDVMKQTIKFFVEKFFG